MRDAEVDPSFPDGEPMPTATPAYLKILARINRGDRSAMSDLMASEQDYVEALAQRLLKPPLAGVLESLDVVQEVAIGVIRQTGRLEFHTRAQARGWLASCVRSRLHDLHRRHFRTARRIPFTRSLDAPPSRTNWSGSGTLGNHLTGSAPGPSSIARTGEDKLRLRQALLRIREDHRTLIERVCFHHQPLVQIASQEGKSSGSVRMQFRRALASCRRAFDDLEQEGGRR